MESIRERADALRVITGAMFRSGQELPVTEWAARFPVEVILYALIEADLKQRRTEGMTAAQTAMFAEKIMLRRHHEVQDKDFNVYIVI